MTFASKLLSHSLMKFWKEVIGDEEKKLLLEFCKNRHFNVTLFIKCIF